MTDRTDRTDPIDRIGGTDEVRPDEPPGARPGDAVFQVGDRVRVASSDEFRQQLIGREGYVVASSPLDHPVLCAVVFSEGGRWTMLRGVDELDLIDRPGQPVRLTTRRPPSGGSVNT